MRRLLAAALLLGCNASLAQVSTMGTTAPGFRSCNSRDGRDLFHTVGANHTWSSGGASSFPVVDSWHSRNDAIATDDADRAGYLVHAGNWKCDRAVDIFPAAGNII